MKQTYNLFLDDFREPEDAFSYTHNQTYLIGWVVVRNYNDFVNYILTKGMPSLISFDHDLADFHYDNQHNLDQKYYDTVTEKTGYHCAKWLVNYCIDNDLDLPDYLAHTMNTVGRKNILSLLDNYKKFRENGKR